MADLQGAILHPLVILTTVSLGVLNGAKLTVVFSMFLAGAAQWWLGRELRLGWLARIWSSLLAVVGAHLAGRLENGWMGIVLAAATASFFYPAAIRLARHQSRRVMIILAVILAMTLVSGQGYIQLGLLAASPVILFLLPDVPQRAWKLAVRFLSGAALALLLAAPLLAPVMHFLPNISKPRDPQFHATQPFPYYLLNLVIGDRAFYYDTLLQKPATPAHTALLIGWAPVMLALFVPKYVQKQDRAALNFLAASSLLILLLASGSVLAALHPLISALDYIRNPMLIGPIGIPPILATAAYTLDQILRQGVRLPAFLRRINALARVNLVWLAVLPLGFNVWNVWQFSSPFLAVQTLGEDH